MTSSSVLSFALVLLFGALMVNALPACCTVQGGTYNESVTTLSSALHVVCSNCDSTLTTLGVFPGLTTLNAAITLTCTNCPSITTLGSFPLLVSTNSTISLTCTTCPAVTLVGGFSVLRSNNFPISLTCTTCDSLDTVGNFPDLTSVQSQITVTCTTCNAVTSLGNFTVLTSACYAIQLTCTTCQDITTIGNFPSLTTVCDPVALTCTTCPSLIHDGYYPALSSPPATVYTGAALIADGPLTANTASSSKSCRYDVNGVLGTGFSVSVNVYSETTAVCCMKLGTLSGSSCTGTCSTTPTSDYIAISESVCAPSSLCIELGDYDGAAEGISIYKGAIQTDSSLGQFSSASSTKNLYVLRSTNNYAAAYKVMSSTGSTYYACVLKGVYDSGGCEVVTQCQGSPAPITSSRVFISSNNSNNDDDCYALCYAQ